MRDFRSSASTMPQMCQDIGDSDEGGTRVDKGPCLIGRHLKEGTPIAELAAASNDTSVNETLMFAILHMWTTCGQSKPSFPVLRVDC